MATGGGQGAVQQAFGSGAAAVDGTPLEEVLSQISETPGFKEHYGPFLEGMGEKEKKLANVRCLLPIAKAQVLANPDGTEKKRNGVLNGYRGFAEKKGIPWKDEAECLAKALGPEGWEKARKELTRVEVYPDYYVKVGQGTLHSYAKGNDNWECAFDQPSAYMLVHMHHYPDKTPQEAFDQLHKELDDAALDALDLGQSPAPVCIDIGCGVGTSAFSTRRSLDLRGLQQATLLGVDLCSHFITVARHRQEHQMKMQNISFEHGDALNLRPLGVKDGSVDLVVMSEVTHEMPTHVAKMLMQEVSRVLRPGGVLGYMDLNPSQLLRDNTVANLVSRIAISNEPYLDEYLEEDMCELMEAEQLEVVNQTWPNKAKYATMVDCSLRIIIARKRASASL